MKFLFPSVLVLVVNSLIMSSVYGQQHVPQQQQQQQQQQHGRELFWGDDAPPQQQPGRELYYGMLQEQQPERKLYSIAYGMVQEQQPERKLFSPAHAMASLKLAKLLKERETQQKERKTQQKKNGRALYAKFRNNAKFRIRKKKGKTNNMRKANLRLRREVHTLLNVLRDRIPNVVTSADTPATDTGASISVTSDNPNSY